MEYGQGAGPGHGRMNHVGYEVDHDFSPHRFRDFLIPSSAMHKSPDLDIFAESSSGVP